jgi:hypothetical protein
LAAPLIGEARNIRGILLEQYTPQLHFKTKLNYAKGSERFGKINPDTVGIFKTYFGRLDSMPNPKKNRIKKHFDSAQFRYFVQDNGEFKGFDYDKKGRNAQKRMMRKIAKELKRFCGKVADSIQQLQYLAGEKYLYSTIFLDESAEAVKSKTIDGGKEYYTIQSPEFGFINCDRFTQKSNLTNFTYSLADSIVIAQAFFLDIKACMQNFAVKNSVVFAQIPANSKLLIIATGSMNGKPIMQIISDGLKNEKITEPFDLDTVLKLLEKAENPAIRISQAYP